MKKLLDIADRLLGENGCPWDKKQTFHSLQPYLTEEVHEVLEAVDENNDKKIVEELGDLLYNIVFYAKLGETQGRFTWDDIVENISNKLIYRHPHIFGDAKAMTADEVVDIYEKAKSQEKGKEERKHPLDGIPPTLPLLVRAQKVLRKITKEKVKETISEEEIASELLSIVSKANNSGVDLESTLRRALTTLENQFRKE